MSKTVISVENLTKRYDLGVIGTGTLTRDLNRWWARTRGQPDPYTKIGQEDKFMRIGESILALDDVSFTVQQGEALGIIGKNGAGKSTLLKILSRVTAPTSGEVKIRGRIGSLLEVGTGFHPELTGRENVFLNGAILGMRKDEVAKKFDEIVDFSGVEKFIDTPVKRYSSGMYVRLAFAVAAHLDPEILIVDEVLAVGDAEFQKKCLGKMEDVAGEGRTVLFVSHNLSSIKTLCNKCLVLEKGKITFEPSITSKALTFYNNRILEDATSINLATRTDRKGNRKLQLLSFEILDEKDNQLVHITNGEFIKIRLKYHSFTDIDYISVTISFGTSVGDNKLLLWSKAKDHLYSTNNNKGYFDCFIPKFPLTSGSYLMNVYVESRGETLDWIREVGYVDVIDGDFYGINKVQIYSQQVVIVDHYWE